MTNKEALLDAERDIDDQFGPAYARKNPHMVESMVDAWAWSQVADAIRDLAEAIRGRV